MPLGDASIRGGSVGTRKRGGYRTLPARTNTIQSEYVVWPAVGVGAEFVGVHNRGWGVFIGNSRSFPGLPVLTAHLEWSSQGESAPRGVMGVSGSFIHGFITPLKFTTPSLRVPHQERVASAPPLAPVSRTPALVPPIAIQRSHAAAGMDGVGTRD